MNIAILDDYQDAVRQLPCFGLLAQHEVKIFNSAALGMMQLAVRLAPFEVLVLNHACTSLSAVLLAKLPKLRCIIQTGESVAHIDLQAVQQRGIHLSIGADDPVATAELTWALILAASRSVPQYANHLRQGLWQTASIDPQRNRLGRSLHGKTLAIWGYGSVAQLVARYGQAFGVQGLIWVSTADAQEAEQAEQAQQDGYTLAASWQQLFADADVLSLHVPLSERSLHAIGPEDLARMKPDALLVNTSHASLLQPEALVSALQLGRPGSAALDVFDKEPLKREHPLFGVPGVLATPHIGDVTQESYARHYRAAFEQVLAFAATVNAAEIT